MRLARSSVYRIIPAAIVVLVGACGEIRADDSVAAASESAAVPSPCDGAALDARLQRRPYRRIDGHVSFAGGALGFVVPAAIPVAVGASGHGHVRLTFSLGSDTPTTCVYRGDGPGGRGGDRFVFVRCRAREESSWRHGHSYGDGDDRDDGDDGDDDDTDDGPGDPLPVAGSTVSADAIRLVLARADRHVPLTAVHLALPGPVVDDADACTADACEGVTGTVMHEPLDTAVCRGRANFHDRTLAGLGGNGRACSDCHMDSQRFQLTPAAARARFDLMNVTGNDDPLFRPIDADDFRVNGAAAHEYTNLIENGLIRVTIPLPPNVRLLDCGSAVPCPVSALPTTETVADVWRAVPPVLDVAITGPDGQAPAALRGPNPHGGYQLDGRIDTLQNQALGALRNHASVAVDPPARWLDDVTAFQTTLFSSPSVADLAQAMAVGASPLPDPDPFLSPLEAQGKLVFNRACAQCHGDQSTHPSGSTPIVQGTEGTPTEIARYHTVATTCPRPVDNAPTPRYAFAPCSQSQMKNVRTYEITNSGSPPTGTLCGGAAPQPPCITRVTTSDPGRMLLTGYPVPGGPGDIEHLDVPSLRGVVQTAPYFSNNTAATLEDVVEHYKQLFKRVEILAPAAPLLTSHPGVVPPVWDRPFTDDEVPALLAYLRKI